MCELCCGIDGMVQMNNKAPVTIGVENKEAMRDECWINEDVEEDNDWFRPFRSLEVLLVENDDSTRHVLSALLRNCGHEVKAVENGKKAWEVLKDLTVDVDLVLSEVVMPCLSGIGLLNKIKRKKVFKDIPVIMMSSHDSRRMVFKCLSEGAVDFLVKPIRKNELKNLWQHVWRKYQISNGASGSESSTWIEKPMKSRTTEDLENNTSSNDEDDTESIDLDFRNESDIGTQGSWTMASQNQCSDSPDNTSTPFSNNWMKRNEITTLAGKDTSLDKTFMGKDLRIGICITSSFQLEDTSENGLTNTKLNSNEDDKNMEKRDFDLNNEQPDAENAQAVNLLGISANSSNFLIENAQRDIENQLSKDTDMTEKYIYENEEIPFFEVILKRPRDVRDTGTSAHNQNVLRQSDLSAFSRYNSASKANLVPTGNVHSSPFDNSPDDAARAESAPNNQSDSNSTPPNQRSHGSSNNNDMGSTTDDLSTKQVSFPNKIQSTSPFPLAHDDQPSEQPNTQGVSQSGSSNVLRATMDGNISNRNLSKGASGSKHGRNGHKKNTTASNSRGKKFGSGSGKWGIANDTVHRNKSEEDEKGSAKREAALKRYRQKRQERCFEKKIRYQSRKKLAEQRPRIQGQFIRKGMYENKGKGIDCEPDPTPR